MLEFKKWLEGTDSSCVATFAMPAIGMNRRMGSSLITVDDLEKAKRKKKRKKKRFKEQLMPMTNMSAQFDTINPNETIPIQTREVSPSYQLTPKSYTGQNRNLFSKILDFWNKNPDNKEAHIALIKAQNGDDEAMADFAKKRHWIS